MLGKHSLLSTRYRNVISELWRKVRPAKSFRITEILSVHSIKGFSGKWQAPLSPYTFPHRCTPIHRAALAGQDLASQGLSHHPQWGGDILRAACGDRAGPSSSWDHKWVRIWINRAQAQHGCDIAQAWINHKNLSSPKQWRREPQLSLPRRAAWSKPPGMCLLFFSWPAAELFLSCPWAQAAKPPGRSGENHSGPWQRSLKVTHVLGQMLSYALQRGELLHCHFAVFTSGSLPE